MKIMIYGSTAVIALAMSVGTVSAEDQFSVAKDVPSATTMTDAQLGEIVGGDVHCDEENGHFRRRWFHRRGKGPCQECNGS